MSDEPLRARIFTRWGTSRFFSQRARVEVQRSEDLPDAIRRANLNLKAGELVLVQWEEGRGGNILSGSILTFRVAVDVEEVLL